MLENCKLIRKFGKVNYVYVFREQNKVVDTLTKKALEIDRGTQIFTKLRPPV